MMFFNPLLVNQLARMIRQLQKEDHCQQFIMQWLSFCHLGTAS
ncbi:hypothetical protein [Marinospirillum alkaliphilum]|uniref:Uncharacterized protein n=1 Tax=Marinospirillum alkaliphilum DSM 21637 TaxID=1122209 RepID=A0A1K1W4B4_9GAMM|nr:hypothetical protein [Marinospirillum alkaliphilum]SFX32206.1 hypothetical protein SAMN02745752_01275 [Marinospirillum alkaliphilum DSM 21637]